MGKRYFTADFHLGFKPLLELENRPFHDISEHDATLLKQCNDLNEDDTIVHIGDLASFGLDNSHESEGLNVNPMTLISSMKATFVNIRGNHDLTNRVKSLADSMQIHLGKKFPNVTVGHYPSTNKKSASYIKSGWINLCGHVHRRWKHCLDLKNQILNINCGIDVWNYKIVSEDHLIRYVEYVLSLPKEKINKI